VILESDICVVRGFWATDDLESCKLFTEGHQGVLKEYGYEHFESNSSSWYNEKDTYVILAKIGSKPVGGLRFVRKREGRIIPLEATILPIDSIISDYLNSIVDLNPFEICALWNSKAVGGEKLSYFLSRLGVVLAPHLDWGISLCFMAKYTFRIPRQLGYEILTNLGDEGYFNYPTPEFQAAVWQHSDMENLGNCADTERERVLSLRENLFQEYTEKNTRGGFKIKYELYV
jgi:hypothetical protein